MPVPNRSQLADLRGALRVAADVTSSVAATVEDMHHTILRRPGPLGAAVAGRTRGITGLVYRCVRGGIDLAGRAVDTGLAGVAALAPEGASSPRVDGYRSAANGVCGDYLLRTGNPLAIDMSLRHGGRRLDPHEPLRVVEPPSAATPANKLLVLVHGLCMNDRQWNRAGHDHGAALAGDLGYLPLYLRYNSGLPVATNGALFADLLEMLLANWPTPVDELVIMGHSMGGLVARSACHHGLKAGHAWPGTLRKLVFLGTPHHGAPLERGGHGLDLAMDLSPYSIPLTRLSKARSAGITDLRHGRVSAQEETVPLPSGVQCYAAAAVRAAKHGGLSARLIGDGLVPLGSALGRHRDGARSLGIPADRQWVGYRMGHRDLLNRPEVYRQIFSWMQEPA